MKCIVFTLQDGSQYALPLKLVAEHRAAYYAKKDTDTTFEDEVKFVMDDSFEGIDWFGNNQNPEDYPQGFYKQIKKPDDYNLFDAIRDAESDIEEVPETFFQEPAGT